jgi:AcrR family transcriptional regulator
MSSSQQDLHLWKLPRGRHGLPREVVVRSQRERLIAAVVHVAATKSYQAASVSDILRAAGVGRESFYRYFENKENCFLVANDVLIGNLVTSIAAAYGQSGAWPARVRMGLGASLEWLAADPKVARVMMIEMGTVGPVAAERFRQTFHGIAKLLSEGRELTEDSSVELPNLSRIAGAAIFAQVYEEVALGEAEALPRRLPELTFELLLPFVGEAVATREKKSAEKETAPD